MELTIEKSYPIDFILYLKRFFRFRVAKILDVRRLRKVEDDFYLVHKGINMYVNFVEAVLNCDSIFKMREYENKYVLYFNPVAAVGNSQLRYLDIYKFINYGSLNSRAYPIFTKTFQYLKSKMGYIYSMYEVSEGGL